MTQLNDKAGKAEKLGVALVNKLRDYFDPPQSGEVPFKYYVRTGSCNQCGKCCSDVSLIHGDKIIADEDEFELLKLRYDDYNYFEPVGRNQHGLRFRCKNLSENNECTIYHDRPHFCKKYPSEDTIVMGAELAPGCGFAFRPKWSFDEILEKTSHKKQIKAGKLLNDVVPATKTTTRPAGLNQ